MDRKQAATNTADRETGDDYSTVDQTVKEIKKIVFGLVMNLLKEESISIIGRIVMIIIELFQILYFCFRGPLLTVWKQYWFVNTF